MTLVRRFWRKVDTSNALGCWEWTAHKDHCGYGRITINGKVRRAHRISWVFSFGEIPQGFCVCHSCDNPGCVNPAHLWVGTHLQNMRDRDQKGRAPSNQGNHNGNAHLSEADVIQIRERLQTERMASVARDYGVSHSCVRHIKHGRTWRHI